MRMAVALSAAFGAAFLASSARAERVGLVVRIPTPSPATPAILQDALATAGSAAGATVVRAPFREAQAALSRGAVPASRLEPFGRSGELLREGLRAYASAELEFAAGRLAEARRLAIQVADLPGGAALVAEISLRLGAVRLDLGQAAAFDDFRLAARLAPDRMVTMAEFKPTVVEAFEREVAADVPVRRLTIRAGVEDARAVVDGGAAVALPWQGQVPGGLHLVRVSAPGHVPRAELVRVAEDRAVRLRLDEDRARAAVERGREALRVTTSEDDAEAAVTGLLRYAQLDSVVLATAVWRRGSATLLAQRCAGVPVHCQRSVEVRYGQGARIEAAARELWARAAASGGRLPPALMTDVRVVSAEAPPGSTEPTSERPWTRNPLVWAGVGAGVAAAITAAVLLGEGSHRRPEIDIDGDFFGR